MAATHPHAGANPGESSDFRQALLQLEDDAAVMELNAAFWKCLIVKEEPECLWHDQCFLGIFWV